MLAGVRESPLSKAIDLTGRSPLSRAAAAGSARRSPPACGCRASVVIASRKKENLEAAAAELAGLAGKVVPIVCHLGRADRSIPGEGDRVALGSIDILVNNSATNVGQGPSLEVTDEMLDKMVEINIKAALRLMRPDRAS